MRIQHNILAMNAYRNYNTNTSALAKNLEKLSSGYKINRAGDDAAGLAISEKMRAQITGLNAAQKNVKDGISLVKTAEGAMQEIQDMLNRMDYLATQSANGTYQDEVDRENLNKEMEALKTEINRIADSANFNGIKLLDGSLDTTKLAQDAVSETVTVDPTETEALTVGGKLAGVGQTLGVDTVLHNDKNGEGGTSFDVDLHNFKFDASKMGNNMTLKVGDTEFKLTVTTAIQDNAATTDVNESELTGETLVNAILGKNANISVEVNGKKLTDGLTFENDGIEYTDNTSGITKLTIGGQEFDVAATNGNTTTNGALSFTQTKAPTNESEVVNGSMEVTITGATAATKAQYSADITKFQGGGTVTIGGKEYDAATIANATATLDDYDLSISEDGTKVLFTAKVAGAGTIPEITVTSANGAAETATAKFQNGSEAVKAVYTSDTFTADSLAALLDGKAAADTVTIAGHTYTLTADNLTDTVSDFLDDFVADYNTAGKTGDTTKLLAAKNAAGDAITFTADAAGALGGAATPPANFAGKADLTETTAGADATAVTFTYDLSKWDGKSKVEIDGVEVISAETAPGAGDATVTAGNITIGNGTYTAALSADGKTLTLTDTTVGALGGSASSDKILGDAEFTAEGTKEKVAMGTIDKGSDGSDLENITQGSNGDWNVSTTNVKQVNAGGLDRLASTYFELTEDMIKDGSVLSIGGQDYTFTTDKVILENDPNAIDVSSGDLAAIAQKLTEVVNASNNEVWSVGVGKTPTTITLTETEDHAGFGDGKDYDEGTGFRYDLSTIEGIEESLGFKGVSYTEEKVVSEATEGGKALNLQIGDTSDEFNQMKVSIGDMHVTAMGTFGEDGKLTKSIDEVDILNPENAAEAVDVIKNAINYVSSVRGDLGAYQNRLEHTANNLSVMAENIQDAESTIRDTDVAEEMMAYTKNNILIQSAQAMLAQANAVPQGVLQLLG